MEKVQNEILAVMSAFIADAGKKSSKAARLRMRKATLKLDKLGKEFRRLSIEEDKKA